MAWPQGADITSGLGGTGFVSTTRDVLYGSAYPTYYSADGFGVSIPFTYLMESDANGNFLIYETRNAEVLVEVFDEQNRLHPESVAFDPANLIFRMRVQMSITNRQAPHRTGNLQAAGLSGDFAVAFDYAETVTIDVVDGRPINPADADDWVVGGTGQENDPTGNDRMFFAYSVGSGGGVFGGARRSRIYRCGLQHRYYAVRVRFTEVAVDLRNNSATLDLLPMVTSIGSDGDLNTLYGYANITAAYRRVAPAIAGSANQAGRSYVFQAYRDGAIQYAQFTPVFSPDGWNTKRILNFVQDVGGWFAEDGTCHLTAHTTRILQTTGDIENLGYKEFVTSTLGRGFTNSENALLGTVEWSEMVIFASGKYRQFGSCSLLDGGAAAVASFVDGETREVHLKIKKADGTWPDDDEVTVIVGGLTSPASVAIWPDQRGNLFIVYGDYFGGSGGFTGVTLYSSDGGQNWQTTTNAPI